MPGRHLASRQLNQRVLDHVVGAVAELAGVEPQRGAVLVDHPTEQLGANGLGPVLTLFAHRS